ncbi:NUDIX hydrolase [Halioxenophilus aromaticivorans]|uniref:NUDIX domain-containing protein n=1 Tax=Halioxenophilus aromaticivorans TaxID=1306992 RepID=A0AAV3UAH7_9ALTE
MSEFTSEKAFLEAYSIHEYDVPLLTVDMAIFSVLEDQLQVLLVKRAQHPSLGKWALPGGFVDTKRDKSLVETAKRKLRAKTGVATPYVEQVETFGGPERDPRGWSVTVAYMALIPAEGVELVPDDASSEVIWVPVKEMGSEYLLAFDHQSIFEVCLERLKNKVQYSSLPVNLLPKAFTLTELQRTFEIVLGQTVEKKSFRRRILDAGILEETGAMKTGSSRPAKLYRVRPEGQAYFFPRTIEGKR